VIDPAGPCLDNAPAAPLDFALLGQTYVRILEMIVRAEPLEIVMTAIVRAMAADPGIGGGAILLLDDGGLEPVACSGISSEVLDRLRSVPVGDLLDDASLATH